MSSDASKVAPLADVDEKLAFLRESVQHMNAHDVARLVDVLEPFVSAMKVWKAAQAVKDVIANQFAGVDVAAVMKILNFTMPQAALAGAALAGAAHSPPQHAAASEPIAPARRSPIQHLAEEKMEAAEQKK